MRTKSATVGTCASRQVIRNKINKSVEEEKPKTDCILVTRNTGGIGDMLMISPVFRQIKKSFPGYPLIVCTTHNYQNGVLFSILEHNPYVDKVITVNELSNYNFVKMFNFNTQEELTHEKGKSKTNRIDSFEGISGLQIEDKRTVYVVSEKEKEWAKNWIITNIPKSRRTYIVGMQISTSTVRRNWPLEKEYLLALSLVSKFKNLSVLFFCDGMTERTFTDYPNIYVLNGLPIRQVGSLINECDLLVFPDSGLLHIAGALEKNMIGLFGSNHPESRLKYYKNSEGIWLNYPCSPCWYDKCESNFKCMSDISVNSVMSKVTEKLGMESEDFVKSVLIIRMGGIGDLILLSNSLIKYKEKYPDRSLILSTKFEEVLKGAPFLSKIISLQDSWKTSSDTIIDLRYKVEAPELGGTLPTELYKLKDRVDNFENLLGVEDGKPKKFYVCLDKSKESKIKDLINYDPNFKYIGIQATCTSNTRTFPPEYVPEICRLFKKSGLKVVLFGKTELWRGRKVAVDLKSFSDVDITNVMDKTDLLESIVLVSLMNFVIAPDSAAIHIAGVLDKKCLGVFGNIDPNTRITYFPNTRAIYPEGEIPCIPCWDFINPCKWHDKIGAECMRRITPKRIFETGKEWFNL